MSGPPSWTLYLSLLLSLPAADAPAETQSDVELPTPRQSPAEPFQPRTERSEEGQDQLTAAARFSHGRLLLHQRKPHAALREFERAWRYDQDATPILREIIKLSHALKRHSEKARYAVLAAERRPQVFAMHAKLAEILVQQDDNERAARLLELAVALDPPQDAALVALHVELGRLNLLLNRPQPAAASFAVVLEALQDPDVYDLSEDQIGQILNRPELLFRVIVRACLEAGELDLARKAIEVAADSGVASDILAYLRAEAAVEADDWEQAAEQLDLYLQSERPRVGGDAYRLLQQILEKTADDPRGQLLARLTELAAAQPKNAALHYFHADELLAADKQADAAAAFRRAGQLEATNAGDARLAEIYLRLDDAAAFLSVLSDHLKRTGSSLRALRETTDKISGESEFFQQVIQEALAQRSEPARLAATLLAISAGQMEEADKLFRATLDTPPVFERHQLIQRVALALFSADEPARSAELFKQAIEVSSSRQEQATDHYLLAGALALAGEHEAALTAAERSAELNPVASFQARPAWILYHAERYDEAEQRYREVIDEFDRDFSSDRTRDVLRDARLVLANLAVLEARVPDAVEWLEQVLDEFPEDPGALNDLGYLWVDSGQHLERSLRMVQQAVEAMPDNLAYRDSLGWAYYRLERYDEAIAELEKAAAGESPDGVILDHLGDAYLKADQPEKAIETWQRAVDSFRESGEEDYLHKTEAKLNDYQTTESP